MALSMSAAPVIAPRPLARITASGLTVTFGATVTVRRSWAGNLTTVRTVVDAPITGTSMVFDDAECPFGVPVSYQATVRGPSGAISARTSTGSPLVLDVSVPWISDPLAPAVACAVTLHSDALASLTYSRAGDVSQPLGSELPVAVVGARMAASSVPIDLLCRTLAARDAALAVLRSADPVCLRTPHTTKYSMLPDLCYVTADAVDQQPLTVQYGSTVTRIGWTGTLVRAPAAAMVVPPRTCADVLAEAATCGDLTALYATCNDLLLGG